MPSHHKSKKQPIVEPSLSESDTESEEEIVLPSKKSKTNTHNIKEKSHKKVATPEVSSESESSSEDDDNLSSIMTTSQDIFDSTYEKYIKRSSGKAASKLPDNTNLYIKLLNNETQKTQWKAVVYSKNNSASDIALQAVAKYLSDKDYKVSYRVEKPRQ